MKRGNQKEEPIYRCAACGRQVPTRLSRIRILDKSCIKRNKVEYEISKASTPSDREWIAKSVERFWGEQEQLSFDRKLTVSQLPAFIARTGEGIAGFVSYSKAKDAFLIIALGVLPKYQGAGMGDSLVKKVESEAKKARKSKILVSTSNDDLPALGFYQSRGYQIFEVKPNVIADKHGKILKGIGGLPVRDELRLQKILRT